MPCSYCLCDKVLKGDKTDAIDIPVVKGRKKRVKLTKDERNARKKKRTPEQQKKINERMAKLRAMRKKK